MTEINLRCKKCGRWLGKANTSLTGVIIKCGNCKTNNEFTVVMQSDIVRHSWYARNRRVDQGSNAKGQSKTADDAQATV